MVKCGFLSEFTRVHFIGIGGISMSGLAKYCLSAGKIVSGSDIMQNDRIFELIEAGAFVYAGHRPENVLKADLVVYTSAVGENNPELTEAKRRGIKLLKRSELLGKIMGEFENSVAVAGCHGKTTTTAMIARIFAAAGKDPAAFIGGVDGMFNNFRDGKGDFAVCEACEYRCNFLDVSPTVAVVLNIDDDHLDSYGSLDNVKKAFKEFSKGYRIVNADDPNCAELLRGAASTFGLKDADYTACDLKRTAFGYGFGVRARGKFCGEIELRVKGIYNVYNALAAIAVCDGFFIPFGTIKKALEEFCGVERRMERIGSILGIECFADYAHHPVEIAAACGEFSENYKDFLVVFQPHTYSRTKTLMPAFTECFKNLRTVIYKTYPAREEFDAAGSAYALFLALEKAESRTVLYAGDPQELKKYICLLKDEISAVLFLGAGDIYETAKSLTD